MAVPSSVRSHAEERLQHSGFLRGGSRVPWVPPLGHAQKPKRRVQLPGACSCWPGPLGR